jgi:hypothetical protein
MKFEPCGGIAFFSNAILFNFIFPKKINGQFQNGSWTSPFKNSAG